MSDTREQLSTTSVGLHWIIGITMICMVFFGLYLGGLECAEGDAACKASKATLTGLHKSVGMLVLVFALWRLVRRLAIGMLVPVGDYATWERVLAKIVGLFLLLATLLLPLSGIVMSVLVGRPIAVFGLPIVPPNLIEPNKALGGIAHETHELLGWALLAAVSLHILGALKHHIIDGDGTLKRIVGARVTPVRNV